MKTKPRPSSERARESIGERATVLAVDGNSISAIAGGFRGDTLHIDAVQHLEFDKLVEVSRRIRHPIFMDSDVSFYPGKEKIIAEFSRIMDDPAFQNPVAMVCPPDRIKFHSVESASNTKEITEMRRLLLNKHLTENPNDYPCLFFFQDFPTESGMTCVRLAIFRFAEYLHLQSMVENMAQRFLGIVPASVCMRNVIHHLLAPDADEGLTVCNVGKLRTIYSSTEEGGQVTHHPIPIGMARDDINYFRSFRPKMDELIRLRKTLGTLMLPMDSTPSPLLRGKMGTPQTDCTRIAIQLTRFASRAGGLDANMECSAEGDSRLVLCGLGSRIPGLLEYVSSRVSADVQHLDEITLSHLEWEPTVDRESISDAVYNLGALIEVLRPSKRQLGLIGGSLDTPPMARRKCSVSRLKEGVLYVLERKLEV